MTVSNTDAGGRGRERGGSTYRERTQSFLVLEDAKLLRLGYRSSRFELRSVSALLVFYSSLVQKMQDNVKLNASKHHRFCVNLKGKMFTVKLRSFRQTFCRISPPPPPTLLFQSPFPFYFASTVTPKPISSNSHKATQTTFRLTVLDLYL
jgi:hypothetical protein